jgi:hypothetical protein
MIRVLLSKMALVFSPPPANQIVQYWSKPVLVDPIADYFNGRGPRRIFPSTAKLTVMTKLTMYSQWSWSRHVPQLRTKQLS